MAVLVGRPAPNFAATAVFGKECRDIKLSDYRGKYLLLFFYPLNFSSVCPTELHALHDRREEFARRETELLACSVDSQFSHLTWLQIPKEKGGIEGISVGLIADIGASICREYDVLSPRQIALRARFLIDREGMVRHQIVNDLPLGRSVDEIIRCIDALQHSERFNESCPGDWQLGGKGIGSEVDAAEKYFTNRS